MAEVTPEPVTPIELALDDLSLLVARFSKDELVAILASAPALVANFTDAAQPFVEQQDADKVRAVEEARLEAEREERQARLEFPERFAKKLLDQLLQRDGEPMPAQELEQTQKRVEDGIRALIAHVVDPSHELAVESVLGRLARLDSVMGRTRSYDGQLPGVPISWNYIGALTLAVEAQRDRLDAPVAERQRVASQFEREFHGAVEWETVWHGYLYETSYVDHKHSLEHDALNTPPQILRIPARCKVPSDRSSSLLQSLPFEIISLVIKSAANDFIPHPKTVPKRAIALHARRAGVLRTLARVSRAWRTPAQRELVRRSLVSGPIGLKALLNMLQRRKLGAVVRELHLDGGKVVQREVSSNIGHHPGRNDEERLDSMESFRQEALKDYEEGLALRTATEKALWTSLVRLGETCRTLPSLRLSNLGNLLNVTEFITPLQLHSLTLQSMDFPTTLIEIPSTIRTLSFLHVNFSTTDRLFDNVRHLTPSHLDTLILLDCSTPDQWNTFNGFPNTSSLPSGKILETITTLHLDATQTATVFLATQHLPAVTTLELFTIEKDALNFTAPSKASLLASETQPGKRRSIMQRLADNHKPRANERWAIKVLWATCELNKLERLILPDEKVWRVAWDRTQEEWGETDERDELALKVHPLEVVWK